MTKSFDPTKPVQTRDGRKARIICTDRLSDESIVALVEWSDSPSELIKTYYSDGSYFSGSTSRDDLVNIPEVTTKIANTYRDSMGRLWCDYPDYAKRKWDCIGTVYVGFIEWTLEDGEPVSAKFVKDSQ